MLIQRAWYPIKAWAKQMPAWMAQMDEAARERDLGDPGAAPSFMDSYLDRGPAQELLAAVRAERERQDLNEASANAIAFRAIKPRL